MNQKLYKLLISVYGAGPLVHVFAECCNQEIIDASFYSGTMMPSKLFCHINLRHLQNQLHCFIWSITFKLFSRVSNNLLKTKCPAKLHDVANIILRKDDCKMGLLY